MYTHATDAGWVSRSHQAISPFRLVRPTSVDEAFAAISGDDAATLIAGGIDLVRRMRSGDVWETLVDISGIGEMSGIRDDGNSIRIGALATHWEIESDPVLAARLPEFQAAWRTIGNIRVRMTGTIGGNLMAAEPGYDGRVLLGVMGAELEFRAAGQVISVPASGVPENFPSPAILTAVVVPVTPGLRLRFDRSLKPAVSVAVAVDDRNAMVGIGCAFPAPVFRTVQSDMSAADVTADLPDAFDNPMGRAAYRVRMAGVLAARAAQSIAAEG